MFGEGVTAAARFAEDPQGWLVLTGPSGSGKTHLAVAIANKCIERNQTAFFIVAADLLDHLRAAYSPENPVSYDDLFEQVRNVPVLVLDDLSMANATPWAQEKLFQVINHRYNNSLPTAVTIRGPIQRLDENLRMIFESIAYLKKRRDEILFDAEHFFDGYKNNPEYAIKAVKEAESAGADWIVLCDTNGGTLPHEVRSIFGEVKNLISVKMGIHAHNDSEVAAANSLNAIQAGAEQVPCRDLS